MAAFCTQLGEYYEGRLLTLCPTSDVGALVIAWVSLSSPPDRVEAFQRVNELQQGAHSHSVKHTHKHTHRDGGRTDASDVAAQ